MEDLVNSFCNRCEHLLKERKMLKTELAQKMGIKKQTLNGYLNGDRIPKAEILLQLSEIFGVSVDYLLTGENYNSTNNSYYLTDEELTYLNKYRNLSSDEKYKVNGYLDISNFRAPKPSVLNDSKSVYTYKSKHNSVPVLGLTAAGFPIAAIENLLAFIETDLPNVQFALYAKGDSMEPVINDGEIIFIQKTPILETGEIGIFKINDEATCKIYYNYSDRIELHSFITTYSPLIYFKNNLNEFQIIGKVILTDEQLRKYNR